MLDKICKTCLLASTIQLLVEEIAVIACAIDFSLLRAFWAPLGWCEAPEQCVASDGYWRHPPTGLRPKIRRSQSGQTKTSIVTVVHHSPHPAAHDITSKKTNKSLRIFTSYGRSTILLLIIVALFAKHYSTKTLFVDTHNP